MQLTQTDIISVLRQYNPWWSGGQIPDVPTWKRAAFGELRVWIQKPSAGRALLLSGPRQVGKTTLFLQAINTLVERGIAPTNILYITFDHPLLKLAGIDQLLKVWRDYEPAKDGPEYLFLDEIQILKDWQVWVKHQVDFNKNRRIAFTGSATPLTRDRQESGVGRWSTVRLPTLSFFEYLQIRHQAPPPGIPALSSLNRLFDWNAKELSRVASAAEPLTGIFHEYLLRGGFPQSAKEDSIYAAQKLLREDIVDKVLKRDMTAMFGVRRVLELEQVFLYLCMHDGGILDMPTLCSNLGLKRPTVASFIDLLESTHLIYRLLPLGYGKEILRGRAKIYAADPAIAPSVLLKGKGLLEDSTALGTAVETAFFKHVFTHLYPQSVAFSYWRDRKGQEVDVIADVGGRLVPFEVKYREQIKSVDMKGLRSFCEEKKIERAYLITKDMADLRVVPALSPGAVTILHLPAALACYWLGQMEQQDPSSQTSDADRDVERSQADT